MINKGFSRLRKRYKRYRSNALIVNQLEDSFSRFFRREASGSLLLVAFTALALIFANVPSLLKLGSFWTSDFTFSINQFTITSTLRQVVNKGFFSIYFFIIALELKRLILVGELAPKKMFILPIITAIACIIIPVSIFIIFTVGLSEDINAWILLIGADIPIIAGLVMFMGNKIDSQLKLFIISVSISINIISILILSFINPKDMNILYIGLSVALILFLYILNKSGYKSTLTYSLFGILLWILIFKSGLHPAISGLMLAIVIPSTSKVNQVRLFVRGKHLLTDFEKSYNAEVDTVPSRKTQEIIESMSQGIEQNRSPMHRLGKELHPFAIFVVLPLFILANVDINLSNITESLSTTTSIGLILALVIGKPLAVILPYYGMVKNGFIKISEGLFKYIIPISFLMGISFSLSLFSADCVLQGELLNNSKLAILTASIISSLLSIFLFKIMFKKN